jgi:hypothetical protein
MNDNFDAARLTLLLSELRLPATRQMWPVFAERSDKEGWPAARLLTVLAENELAERDRRCIERHLAEAKLLPDKTLGPNWHPHQCAPSSRNAIGFLSVPGASRG